MIAAKKEMSQHAQVAKICKKHVVALGIKCNVKSDSFSMGNSVHVTMSDVNPVTFNKIESDLSMYQSGSFNGMEDIYEYSNNRNDIPQTKYLSLSNHFSDELKQRAWDFMRSEYPANAADKPAIYEEARNMQWTDNCPHYMDISYEVNRLLSASGCGLNKENSDKFWNGIEAVKTKDKPKTVNLQLVGGIEISEGTRPGFSEIRFPCKPSADDRSELKNAGFRWSPKNACWYGKTECLPAQFANGSEGSKAQAEPAKPAKTNGDKFRALAESMQSTIDSKLCDKTTNTAKRLAQAARSKLDGEKLKRTQQAMLAIADMQDNQSLPKILQGLTSKKAIFDLMGEKTTPVANGYHQYYAGTGEPSHDTPQAVALWALLKGKTEKEKQDEETKRKIDGLQFSKIPGFFPTPKRVIDIMINKADIQPTDRILEPELGSCAIADRVAELCAEVKGFEVNHTLAEIADKKGYLIEIRDFLTVEDGEITLCEKILMNPPFENKQAIDHTRHAFKFLKEGGILVAILDSGAFNNSDSKTKSFLGWLETLTCEYEPLPVNSFKESGTCVNTYILTIWK